MIPFSLSLFVAAATGCCRCSSHGSTRDATLQKGNATVGARDVGGVVAGKKVTERLFFVGDAYAKEAPTGERISDGVERIAQQKLRADAPVKETHVGGMSKDGIDAVSDQDVIFFPGVLDQMIEGFARGGHCETADCLGGDHQEESQVGNVRQNSMVVLVAAPWYFEEEKKAYNKFSPRGERGRCVGRRMIDQKGNGTGFGGIVKGCDKEFQQMKGRQSDGVSAPLPQHAQARLSQKGHKRWTEG